MLSTRPKEEKDNCLVDLYKIVDELKAEYEQNGGEDEQSEEEEEEEEEEESEKEGEEEQSEEEQSEGDEVVTLGSEYTGEDGILDKESLKLLKRLILFYRYVKNTMPSSS